MTDLSLPAPPDETAVNLIQLYANAGRREDARRLHDQIVARTKNPQYLSVSREAVLFAERHIPASATKMTP